jgi:transcriptional regulator with XRE-family HTH domain
MPRTKTLARPSAGDAELAHRIGHRLREARQRAGLTQQQLAGDRYTKAYVSALETGIARPSMVALTYLAGRLNLPASHFLDPDHPAWNRLEVDMQLASGAWEAAAEGYAALLRRPAEPAARAELLRGRAEALARLDRGRDAIAAASEAIGIFEDLGRVADAALARYWLAYGFYEIDDSADARTQLEGLLDLVRSGLAVEPDFEVRLLMALAAVESREGEHARSLALLEQARGMATDLDDRRRATFLFNLAISYRETGDLEGAIRVGTQGMALYRAAGAKAESAAIANDLALAYLAIGRLDRAREFADEAQRQFEISGDDRFLSAVLETEAQIALADGRTAEATQLASRSRELAHQTGNVRAELAAMIVEARALRSGGDEEGAERRFQLAAEAARATGSRARVREVLREWAQLRAHRGDHRGAYELTSEALAVN